MLVLKQRVYILEFLFYYSLAIVQAIHTIRAWQPGLSSLVALVEGLLSFHGALERPHCFAAFVMWCTYRLSLNHFYLITA